MKDIADRVGVSIESVSRLLNREAGVSPATAQQILDVASNLGFRRKDLAGTCAGQPDRHHRARTQAILDPLPAVMR